MSPRSVTTLILAALAVQCDAWRSVRAPLRLRPGVIRRRSTVLPVVDEVDVPTDGILENVDPLALDNAHAEAMYLLSIDAADADAADAVDAAPPKTEAFMDRHPLLTKSLAMGVTYGLADAAAQLFAFLAHGEVVPLAMRLRRAISLTGVGCLAVGPLLAVWFDFLERIVPGRTKRAIFKRTLLDQAIEVPVMISLIFTLSSLAEGNTLAYCLAKVQLKLLSTWKSCTVVWFPVQFVNQELVPFKWRVLFQALVSFFWDTYLSIVSHAA